MELVKVALYAQGYYSGQTYLEDHYIKKSSYELIKSSLPSEICCGELDGKHSQVDGDVLCRELDQEDRIILGNNSDGTLLEECLIDCFEEHSLNFCKEQEEVKAYCEDVAFENVEVFIRKKDVPIIKALMNLVYGVESQKLSPSERKKRIDKLNEQIKSTIV